MILYNLLFSLVPVVPRWRPHCAILHQQNWTSKGVAHDVIIKMADHITSGSCNYTTSENDKTVTRGFHHSWVIGFSQLL